MIPFCFVTRPVEAIASKEIKAYVPLKIEYVHVIVMGKALDKIDSSIGFRYYS